MYVCVCVCARVWGGGGGGGGGGDVGVVCVCGGGGEPVPRDVARRQAAGTETGESGDGRVRRLESQRRKMQEGVEFT